MASRTTEAAVKKIVRIRNTSAEADALDEAMITANVMVTSVCVPLGYDESLAADIALLAEIEKYLAAHFFCIFHPRRQYQMAKTVAETIETKLEIGLNVTRYGQQAMALDRLGGLKAANNPKGGAMSITWLGTPNCERTC